MFVKIAVPQNFEKVTREHQRYNAILVKLQAFNESFSKRYDTSCPAYLARSWPLGNIFFAYYISELREVYIGINTKEKFLAYRHFGP